MKRQTWLRFAEAIIFCALLFGMLSAVTSIVTRKASIVRFKPFFEKAQECDVLFVGDSHMVNAVFPMELWEDYGITAYNIAGYGNTIPVSYWTLINALDYASPRVVVVGIKDVEKNHKLTGSSSDVHTAFDCYPLSINKIRAIEDLMDDPQAMDDEGNRYVDMKWEYYFPLAKYHSRWRELTKEDFAIQVNRQKGSDMAIAVADPDDYDIIDEDRALDEYGVGFEYLRKIIETCQNRGIDVLLTHLPYPSDPDDQMAANTVGVIAQEYGIGFVDFVNLDQVVDYETDCYDADSHLNPSGAQKVTDYLGRYLVDHYGLEDRRQEESYASWHEDYEAYKQFKFDRLKERTTLEETLMFLHDRHLSVGLAIRAQAEVYWNDKALTLMHNAAREHVFEADAYSKWSNSMFPLIGLEDALWADEAYCLRLNADGFTEAVGSDALTHAQQIFGEEIWAEGKEIHIRVLDDRTGDLILDRQF